MTTPRYDGLVRVSAPAIEPVTLAETKAFLRITHDDDNARIADMITSARVLAEQWLRKSLLTQSWKLSVEGNISGSLRLLMAPVQSITSVTTFDVSLAAIVIPPNQYSLSVAKDKMVMLDTLYGYRTEIVYVAGFGTASDVPKPIKLGILQHVASMVDGSIGLSPIPDTVLQYYMPFRELAI
jgi:uncharacterized phiE125 gp8 family phage protein